MSQNTPTNPQRPSFIKRSVKRQQHLPVVDPSKVKPAPSRLRQAYGFSAQP